MKTKSLLFSSVCLLLAVCMMFTAVGCDSSVSAAAVDLMDGVTAEKVKGNPIDDKFIAAETDFALGLFQNAYKETDGQNLLMSPVSVSVALSMAANGADGDTLKELENFLGRGIELQDLNKYYKTYLTTLPNSEKANLSMANSIWFKDSKRFEVNNSFLQTNANWYNADVFKAPFDKSTVTDINNWVKDNTDGRIDKMVDSIGDRTLMYLLNAVSFTGEWAVKYTDSAVSKGTFTTSDRKFQTAEYMFSKESLYLDDGKATGFIKHYSGDRYAFAALLPNNGTSLKDYVNGLTAERLNKTLQEKDASVEVNAYIPKFSYSFELTLNDQLKKNIPLGFDEDKANFKRMGKADGNIFISDVLHKTAITVDEAGTVASASTKVEMADKMSAAPHSPKTVKLDRPFLYMIIDTAQNIPIFIGALESVEG
ncbi:MAG: serpin family protein [Clostridia bacterium]|nr:serpin family protein [Clostridia bacterium]